MKRFSFSFLQKHQTRLAFLLACLAIVVYFGWINYESILRYTTFRATAFDLGNMDQVVWNTLHGRPFQWTNQGVDWFGPPLRLAQHVEPILLPISLLYLIWADPRMLLTLQTAMLALGALPVYALTRYFIPRFPYLATGMAIGYLFSPALIGVNIFDFHPVALVAPFMLFAAWALTKRRFVLFILFCVLAASCKEEIPAVVGLFGLLVMWKYKRPRLGLALFVGGIAWSAGAFLLMKQLYPGNQGNNFWYRYVELGDTPGDAIKNILRHPMILFTFFVTLDRLFYLVGLFRSGGFFGLLAIEWLLPALPDLAINLLNTNSPQLYSGIYHYNAPIIPFVTLATIHGLARFVAWWQVRHGETVEPIPLIVGDTAQAQRSSWPGFVVKPIKGIQLALTRAARNLWSTRPVTMVRPGVLAIVEEGALRRKSFHERMTDLSRVITPTVMQWVICGLVVLMVLLNNFIMYPKYNWLLADHTPGTREQRIEELLTMIPDTASVSASATLNPHLTRRQYVTVFPFITYLTLDGNMHTVEYVIVDVRNIVPADMRGSTFEMLNQIRETHLFCTIKQTDGVILLARNDVSCPANPEPGGK
ncbi:putative membrane protein [Thermosporothrix hazakensis]|jgi:uncharacterized membrane protein|uniref:DUF2079 domain-containing protein n=2 Tax=Thermosporothrix TaxID=768650 RepID=A0A455SY52_9CHLR|nr:DUF2079 domain-containing protein [Thermosporothrix hazakensis]PZW22983.1 putative membrane protein [Thermosporothrix hazakensis]BBH90074.1 hypothetical protein KTC_48250 [Thermosporothrix sp. COM3]GCE48295.1 hypothetical protein KTH_31640 [Thermosporothrix hazakensis]